MELLFLSFVIGCFIGYHFFAFKVYRQLLKISEEGGFGLDTKEESKPSIRMIKVEKHNNLLYTYDLKSNDFLVQGTTIDEIAENLFTYKKIDLAVIANHDQKIFKVVAGKIYEN